MTPMISAWLCGFIVGILLGKSGIFFYPLNLFDSLHHSIILLPAALLWLRGSPEKIKIRLAIGACGAVWGNFHAAPFYVGPCLPHIELRNNPLQFNRGPAIVLIDGKMFEAKTTDKSLRVGARNAGHDLLGMRVVALNCETERPISRSESIKEGVFNYYFERGGSSQLRGWIEAAIFGSQKNLSMRYTNAFKKTGLVHLLVVSGLHVVLIAGFMVFMLRLPFQILYAATLMTPGVWKIVLVVSEIIAAIVIIAYVVLIDSPQAAQRSGVFFLVWVLGKNLFGIRRPLERFSVCMLMQCLFFPVGFFASGNIMSWAATLFLVAKYSHADESKTLFTFLFDWRLQLKIMCLSSAVFSELSLLSLPANLVFGSAFGMTLYVTIVNLLIPHPNVTMFTSEFVGSFLEIIVKTSYLATKYRWLYFEVAMLPTWLQLVGLLTSSILILNSLRELSIRRAER